MTKTFSDNQTSMMDEMFKKTKDALFWKVVAVSGGLNIPEWYYRDATLTFRSSGDLRP